MEIGKINNLKVIDITDKGVYLDGGEEGHLFVPKRELQEKPSVGDELEVFVYRNAKREAVASGIIPYAIAGEFDFLTVNEVSSAGALLDWGIAKDLFLPSREQTNRLKVDRSYLVYIYYDEDTRQVIATMNVDKHLGLTQPEYKMNQEVDILVAKENEVGYRVIVDNAHWGIIYHSEIFEKIKYGMRTRGYVKCMREDGRIDVALQKQGYRAVDPISRLILDELRKHDGFLPYNDKTDAQLIYDNFGCSKKNFKKSIGTLYNQRQILIKENGISLVNED